jgi:hypothetical protein
MTKETRHLRNDPGCQDEKIPETWEKREKRFALRLYDGRLFGHTGGGE